MVLLHTPAGTARVVALFGALTGIGLVVLLGTVTRTLGNGPLTIDQWWHDLMLDWRTPVGLTFAHVLEFVGGPLPMIIVSVVVVGLFLLFRRPWDALVVAATLAVSEAIAGILKVAFNRPRPDDSLTNTAMTSYPSGHTTLAAATAISLGLVLARAIVWVLAVAWTVLMAWSRTYLGAHWLTDVVGGVLLGASVALVMWVIVAKIRDREELRHGGAALEPLLAGRGRDPL
ncbi:hypothetical protein GCM10025760_29540 [Microbacterium yannicii]|uniref:Phosphatidic acid phosphatase type 2/haloperoxidase domain-containing protein n=1 Tax=Microbacterium yannicii TaxID=671622 RepID=A0ABP9MGA1_9MICO|nr:phosphatase PAP2 family protein [Microbacterium yannicii]MCO5953263.1 phosphatase PAP2 family protein [Microbacterium yannicii]